MGVREEQCSNCIDAWERDMEEIRKALTAIRQFAVELDDWPVDYKKISTKIIEIVDSLNREKEINGGNPKS